MKRVLFTEAARKAKAEKDAAKIAYYNSLTRKVLDQKHHNVCTKTVLEETTRLLDINPEFNAVWNYRRVILTQLAHRNEIDLAETLNRELLTVTALMKRYPKCYWIWNHRRWCLEELKEKASWKAELALVEKLLNLDARNFHGWHYRRYVVARMTMRAREKAPDKESALAAELAIDLGEFKFTTSKINQNISNFSAFHNRAALILKIVDEVNSTNLALLSQEAREIALSFADPQLLLALELQVVKTGMYMDVDDSSIWLYMKWLLSAPVFVEACGELFYDVLKLQLKDVEELNDLEKSDSPTNSDNIWCLKTIIMIKSLIYGSENGVNPEITAHLEGLRLLDPLRAGHYTAQIEGRAALS